MVRVTSATERPSRSIGDTARLDGVGTPSQQALHALGQLVAVVGFGGDVVAGAGLFVAVSDPLTGLRKQSVSFGC